MDNKAAFIIILNDISSPLSLFVYNSFIKQSYKNKELIIGYLHQDSINMETNSIKILKHMTLKNSNIKLFNFSISSKNKLTHGEILNDLIGKSESKYIFPIHPNILYNNNYMNDLIKNLDSDFILSTNLLLYNIPKLNYYTYDCKDELNLYKYKTYGFSRKSWELYKFKHLDSESCIIFEWLKNKISLKKINSIKRNIILPLNIDLSTQKYMKEMYNIKLTDDENKFIKNMSSIITNKINKNVPEVDLKKDGNNFILDIPTFSYEQLPNVSIITITKNRNHMFDLPNHIWKNIMYPPDKLEWVILDDSDNVMTNIIKNDNRIVYKHEKNKFGNDIAYKRNYAVNLCKYDYIVFMDDDDYYHYDHVLAKIRVLLHYSDKQCVYSSPIGIYNVKRNTSQIFTFANDSIPEATLAFKKSFWQEQGFNGINGTGEGYGMIINREDKVIKIPFWFNTISITHKDNFTSELRDIKSSADYSNFFDFFDSKIKQIIQKIF